MLGEAHRVLRNSAKQISFALFDAAQLLNLYIMPIHYYVPICATRLLRANKSLWNHPIDVGYLPLDLDAQREVLTRWIEPFQSEYRDNRAYLEASKNFAGPGFGPIEAQALHGFLRKTKPKRIIEIGSGVSTFCMLEALRENEREGACSSSLACIEPNPSAMLRSAPVRLVDRPVEEVDFSVFDELEAGDLLFVDSTHAVRPVGDVSRIYLEILPRLKSGVYIHIHDIYIPYAFQRDIDRTFMQSMETALLIAMLAHTKRYDILLCMSHLHYADPDALKAAFANYVPQMNDGGLAISRNAGGHFPSSTYLVVN